MTDFDEAARERSRAFDDLMRRNPECPSAPARSGYAFEDPDRFDRWARLRAENSAKADSEKAKPSPTLATDATGWAALDDRMANLIVESVGPAIDRLAERHNDLAEELDKEREARGRLEDRCRELLLEQSKAATTVAKLEVSIAHLELRLANGGDRRGSIIDAAPSLKSIN
jgi:hypothetical protein